MTGFSERIDRQLFALERDDVIHAHCSPRGLGFRALEPPKGVYASVTLAEVRQGLVGLYLFLFNVNQHLNQKELASTR